MNKMVTKFYVLLENLPISYDMIKKNLLTYYAGTSGAYFKENIYNGNLENEGFSISYHIISELIKDKVIKEIQFNELNKFMQNKWRKSL